MSDTSETAQDRHRARVEEASEKVFAERTQAALVPSPSLEQRYAETNEKPPPPPELDAYRIKQARVEAERKAKAVADQNRALRKRGEESAVHRLALVHARAAREEARVRDGELAFGMARMPEVTTAELADFHRRYPHWFRSGAAFAMELVVALMVEHMLEVYRSKAEESFKPEKGAGAKHESYVWLEANKGRFAEAWAVELTTERRLTRRRGLLSQGWTPLHVAKWELVHP